jgi:hypothetical protein
MTTEAPQSKYALDEDTLTMVYEWVDTIPLSRPKQSITRDFSDGGLCHLSLPPQSSSLAYIRRNSSRICFLFSACS